MFRSFSPHWQNVCLNCTISEENTALFLFQTYFMSDTKFQLIPYLTFGGNCEEALGFYTDIFQGELLVVNRYDNPAMKVPEAYHDKILHARLIIDGKIILYASDTYPGKQVVGHSGDVSLAIVITDDLERAKRIFQQLSENGKTGVPFGKQFWGDWHGNLSDKYGVKWNVNFETSQ